MRETLVELGVEAELLHAEDGSGIVRCAALRLRPSVSPPLTRYSLSLPPPPHLQGAAMIAVVAVGKATA